MAARRRLRTRKARERALCAAGSLALDVWPLSPLPPTPTSDTDRARSAPLLLHWTSFSPAACRADVHLVDGLAVEAAAQLSPLGRARRLAAVRLPAAAPGPRAVLRLVPRRPKPQPAVSARPGLPGLVSAVHLDPVLDLRAVIGRCQRRREGPPAILVVRDVWQRQRHQACGRIGHG